MPGSGHGSGGVERVKTSCGEPPKKQSSGVLSPQWIPTYGSDDRGSGGGGSSGDYHLPSINIEFPEEVRKDMDHLVKEIKENLKLGGSGPLSPPLPLQDDPIPSYGGGKQQYGKARSSAHLSHRVSRASPYYVPPSSRQCDISSIQAASANGIADGSTLDASEQMRQQQMRRKQRFGHQRRRYPSTCMNNNGFGSSKVVHSATALEDGPEDPFAMLQELISDGGLIKEAVRRLQLGRLTPKCFNPTGTTTGGTGSGLASGGGRAYDSDDDESCRTPPEHEAEDDEAHHNRHHPLQHVPSSHPHAPNSLHGVAQGVVGANHQRPFPCCEVGL